MNMPERPLTFLPPVMPEQMKSCHFIVIGTGGTGGYLVQDLARYLSTHQHIDSVVTIVDGDVVEEKNLVRQNFFTTDIGQNKAVVTAERYAAHFGVYIAAVSNYLTKPKDLTTIIESVKSDITIVIGCVDNNKTRYLIYKAAETSSFFWIDAGNDIVHGQVVVSFSGSGVDMETAVKADTDIPLLFDMPNIFDYHPELLEHMDKLPTELSCAEHAISAPQTVFANRMASNLCLDFIYNIVEGKIMNANGVWFNIEHQSFMRYALTPTRLNGCIEARKKLEGCKVAFK